MIHVWRELKFILRESSMDSSLLRDLSSSTDSTREEERVDASQQKPIRAEFQTLFLEAIISIY